MKTLLKLLSAVGLALTMVPAFLVFAGVMTWDAYARWMLVGTVLWFVTAPFWMEAHVEAPPPASDLES